jgi:proteic killer suppression protein
LANTASGAALGNRESKVGSDKWDKSGLVARHFLLDGCRVTGYNRISVKIRNFAHKGLKALYFEDSVRGVPPAAGDKLRKMLAFLDEMEDPEELRSLPTWNAHTLTGDRKGTWSLTVTRNQRLTFYIDAAENEICDVSLEDYH